MTAPAVTTTNPIVVALRRMGRTLQPLQDEGKTRISSRALLADLNFAVESSGQPLRAFPATFRQLHDSAAGHVVIEERDKYAEFTYVITSVQQTIENSVKALDNV